MEFNPDNVIDLYTVKKNQVQMIIDRGYSSQNLNYDPSHPRSNDIGYVQFSSDDYVYDAWNNYNNNTNPKDLFHALYINPTNGKTLRVVYLDVEIGKTEVSVSSIRKFQDKIGGYPMILSIPFGTYRVDDIVFITPKKLNSSSNKEIESNMVNLGFNVEIFTWIEMLSISPNHLYNGRTQIVPKNEEKNLIKSLFRNPAVKKDDMTLSFASALPIINTDDIIARYYGAKQKDILYTKNDVFTHDSLLRENMSIRRVR